MKQLLFSVMLCSCMLLPSSGSAIQAGPVQEQVPGELAHEQTTFVVTNAGDVGPGALRQALLDARAGDSIIFDATVFPPAEPMTISVTTALPDWSQGDLTLDASQAGVVLDGSALAAGISGLRIVSDGNRVQGLRITRFPGHGIEITAHARFNVIGGGGRAGNTLTRNDGAGIALLTTASTNVLLGNYLGTTADHGALGNQWGILCLGEAQDNVLLNNVIGFNRADGIRLDGCHHTLISGNHIGTGVDGVSDLGNAQAGVQLLNGAHHNRIGPDNVIAYNRTDGVHLLHATTAANTITRNLIYGNGRLSIEMEGGANRNLAPPVLAHVTTDSLDGSGVPPAATVEIFSGEGDQIYVSEGSTQADAQGQFTLTVASGLNGPAITATVTDAQGNTSALSPALEKPTRNGSDRFEPDGGCSQARALLADGAAQPHTFHVPDDADWVTWQAISGTIYLVEALVPPTSPADLVVALYTECGGQPLLSQAFTFTPEIRFEFMPPFTGRVWLKLINQNPTVFGPAVDYWLSVRTVRFRPPPGALILVAGRKTRTDPHQDDIHAAADTVFRLFSNQNYPTDAIQYLASDATRPGVDGPATRATLQAAISSWAASRLALDLPLTLYLVGQGENDRFYLDGPTQEWITPQDLNAWLAQLESNHPGLKTMVVVDAGFAGSFITVPGSLSKPGRVIITGTGADQPAWVMSPGLIFTTFLGAALDGRQSVFSSFQTATWAVTAAHPLQQPWLDSDGDGIPNEVNDRLEAARRGFGDPGAFCKTPACAPTWPPVIEQVAVRPGAWGDDAMIEARVSDDVEVSLVWALMYPPTYQAPTGPELADDQAPTHVLLPQGNAWYRAAFPQLSDAGAYRFVVYARDISGANARPKASLHVREARFNFPLILR
ncbi:MAG: NosD domain-containing protein [Anaerolineae bacterium]